MIFSNVSYQALSQRRPKRSLLPAAYGPLLTKLNGLRNKLRHDQAMESHLWYQLQEGVSDGLRLNLNL